MNTGAQGQLQQRISKYGVYLLIGAVFAIYIPILSNDYGLDDVYYVDDPRVLEGLSSAGRLLTEYTFHKEDEHYAYRPLTAITFAAERSLFGTPSPMLSHAISIALYLILLLLISKLLLVLLPNAPPWVRLLTLAVFALHPVQTEVVASIKNRDILLASIFGVAMLLKFGTYVRSGKATDLFLGIACFFLGLMSKVTILSFVLLQVLVWYRLSEHSKWKNILSWSAVMVLVLMVFIVLRPHDDGSSLLRAYHWLENPLYADHTNLLDRLGIALQTAWHYIQLALAPYPLSAYYGSPLFELSSWSRMSTYMGLGAILLLVFSLMKWRITSHDVVFGIAWFAVCLLMFCNLAVIVPGVVADRYLFNAILGLGIVVSCLVSRRSWLVWPLIGLLTLGGIWSHQRTKQWKNQLTLLQRDVGHYPTSIKLNNMVATLHYQSAINTANPVEARAQHITRAVNHQQASIDKCQDYAKSWNNLGSFLIVEGKDADRAINAFQAAIRLDPRFAAPHYGLGVCMAMTGRIGEAKSSFQRCLELDPGHQGAQQRLQQLGEK